MSSPKWKQKSVIDLNEDETEEVLPSSSPLIRPSSTTSSFSSSSSSCSSSSSASRKRAREEEKLDLTLEEDEEEKEQDSKHRRATFPFKPAFSSSSSSSSSSTSSSPHNSFSSSFSSSSSSSSFHNFAFPQTSASDHFYAPSSLPYHYAFYQNWLLSSSSMSSFSPSSSASRLPPVVFSNEHAITIRELCLLRDTKEFVWDDVYFFNYCWNFPWLATVLPEILSPPPSSSSSSSFSSSSSSSSSSYSSSVTGKSEASKKRPNVTIVAGTRDKALWQMLSSPEYTHLHKIKAQQWSRYSCHHTKLILLFSSARGCRVIITTSNARPNDFLLKNQAHYVQDFPRREHVAQVLYDYHLPMSSSSSTSSSPASSTITQSNIGLTRIGEDFKKSLIQDYLGAYEGGQMNQVIRLLQAHDFSAAKVLLLPSVPQIYRKSEASSSSSSSSATSSSTIERVGAFTDYTMFRYGHLKLRWALAHWCTVDEQKKKQPIIAQFSSIGTIKENWFKSFAKSLSSSMSSGFIVPKQNVSSSPFSSSSQFVSEFSKQETEDFKRNNYYNRLRLIWPTRADVRASIEGYQAGESLCCNKDKLVPLLTERMYLWNGREEERHEAMPHIKSYSLSSPYQPKSTSSSSSFNKISSSSSSSSSSPGDDFAWCVITSCNLSKVSWGEVQVKHTQIKIDNYELGVLFLPQILAEASQHPLFHFSLQASSSAAWLEEHLKKKRREEEEFVRKNGYMQKKKKVRVLMLTPKAYLHHVATFGERSSSSSSSEEEDVRIFLCPLPYSLHSNQYTRNHEFWEWTTGSSVPDRYGETFRIDDPSEKSKEDGDEGEEGDFGQQ